MTPPPDTSPEPTRVDEPVSRRFYLEQDDAAPKKWVMVFLDGERREPSWEEIVLWLGVSNLTQRVRELEAG